MPLGCTAAAVLPKQDNGTSQIEVNPTQVRQQMGHPVSIITKLFFNAITSINPCLLGSWKTLSYSRMMFSYIRFPVYCYEKLKTEDCLTSHERQHTVEKPFTGSSGFPCKMFA